MTSLTQTLNGLRDVEGVNGSFVATRSGSLLAKDLPAMFDAQLFSELGPRIERLEQALAGDTRGVGSCVLRFSEHKLFLRFIGQSILGVITSVSVNAATLRMALSLTARRLEGELAALPFSDDPQHEAERLALRRPSAPAGAPTVGAPVTPPDLPTSQAATPVTQRSSSRRVIEGV